MKLSRVFNSELIFVTLLLFVWVLSRLLFAETAIGGVIGVPALLFVIAKLSLAALTAGALLPLLIKLIFDVLAPLKLTAPDDELL